MDDTIGIDVSKDNLDVHFLAEARHRQYPNTRSGRAGLIRRLGAQPVSLVVFEATGVYSRSLEQALGAGSTPFAKVNPKQARRFAQASGRLAKTDRVDAEMLARMGAALRLAPSAVIAENLHDLKEMTSARRALIKDRTAAKTRRAAARNALVQRQLDRRLRQIERDIRQIDTRMMDLVDQDQQMRDRMDILTSIPGLGETTALQILVDMPEIGALDDKQVASLAGLAPMSQSSGTWRGKARIQGGRAALRCAIFMPALVATRFNPDLRAKYLQLLAAGKEKKVAITAIMRKLLILANALLRDNRKWTKQRP